MYLINQEFDWLERIGIISKVQYSEWAEHSVYIKKNNKHIRVCADLQVKFKEENKADLPECYFYSIWDEMLICAEHVVISLSLQKRILSEFHWGYPGMSRMKSFMRSYVFWSGMLKDIEKTVRNGRGCALAAKLPSIISNSWPKADTTWSRLHINFAGPLNGSYYLVVVNSLRRWPEILKRIKLTSTMTIDFLLELFVRYMINFGWCESVTAGEFKKFCDAFAIM